MTTTTRSALLDPANELEERQRRSELAPGAREGLSKLFEDVAMSLAPTGLAAEVLESLGVNLDKVRHEVIRLTADEGGNRD